jgi:hypothetical protein
MSIAAGWQLGNFPQAFSRIGINNTARDAEVRIADREPAVSTYRPAASGMSASTS